jgi:hypothetical protein
MLEMLVLGTLSRIRRVLCRKEDGEEEDEDNGTSQLKLERKIWAAKGSGNDSGRQCMFRK